MQFVVITLVSFQSLTLICAPNSGFLAFMKAGSTVSLTELWGSSTLSDTTDMYRHRHSLKEMISANSNFRSPLVDRWSELNIFWVEIDLYNYQGEWMETHHFEGATSGTMAVDFVQTSYLHGLSTDQATTDLWFGPSVYIYESFDVSKFSFLSINMEARLAALDGEQFLISASTNYNHLTSAGGDAEHVGCYYIPVSGNNISIDAAFQCTYHCLTVPLCNYFGIFTGRNETSNQIKYVCVPLGSMPADQRPGVCNSLCPDQRLCGLQYTTSDLTTVIADIYSMVSSVVDDLTAMKNTSLTYTDITHTIDQFSTIDLGSQLFIGGIHVAGDGSESYTVAFLRYSCADLFQYGPDLSTDGSYHAYNTGTVTTFTTSTLHTFSPVGTQCIYFNSTQSFLNRATSLLKVNNRVILADYMAVAAEWQNAECSVIEVMSKKDIIPDSAIIISQTVPDYFDFADEKWFTVPVVSYSVVKITLNDGITEGWIKSLTIKASVAVIMHVEIRTSRHCTDQQSGTQTFVNITASRWQYVPAHTPTYENFDMEKGGTGAFCAENITVEVRTDSHVNETTFSFCLKLRGCRLNQGETTANTQPVTNLFDTHQANVEAWWIPRPTLAYNAIRPRGVGLMFRQIGADYSGASIRLSDYTDVPVNTIVLHGTLMAATVEVGGEMVFMTEQSGFEALFSNRRGQYVNIYDIQANYTGNASVYPVITVEIEACVIARENTSTTMNIPSTTQPVTSNISTTAVISSTTSLVTTDISTSSDISATTSLVTTGISTSSDMSATSQPVPTLRSTSAFVQATTLISTTDTSVQQPGIPVHPVSHSTTTGQPTEPAAVTTVPHTDTSTTQPSTSTPSTSATIDQGSTTSTTSTTVTTTMDVMETSTTSTHTITETSADTSSTSTIDTTTASTPAATTASNPTGCLCGNKTTNITEEELETIVKEIVKNLTIPVTETSSFRRSKMSMPDIRRSSKAIGTAGLLILVIVGGIVVLMDLDHILSVFNVIKRLLCRS